MIRWMLLTQAWAAEPDLSGLHVALGGGLQASLGPFPNEARLVDGSFRLHVGPRVLAEISASGRHFTDVDWRDERYEEVDGEIVQSFYGEVSLEGWRASAGLRLLGRVAHRDGLDFYLGVAGSYAVSDAKGPIVEQVWDDDGIAVPTMVGEQREKRGYSSVSASFSAVHWATDRVAVSGLIEIPAWGVDQRHVTETRDVPFVAESSDVTRQRDLGGAPVVGLAVHLRL